MTLASLLPVTLMQLTLHLITAVRLHPVLNQRRLPEHPVHTTRQNQQDPDRQQGVHQPAHDHAHEGHQIKSCARSERETSLTNRINWPCPSVRCGSQFTHKSYIHRKTKTNKKKYKKENDKGGWRTSPSLVARRTGERETPPPPSRTRIVNGSDEPASAPQSCCRNHRLHSHAMLSSQSNPCVVS